MTIATSLRSELLKTKRTAALYFTLIGAAVVPLLLFFNVLSDGLPDKERSVKDPLNALFKLTTEMNSLAIFPLFIVLLCTLLPQIEFKNNTWKQVLTSPQTKGTVFLAKFLNVQLLLLLFLVASHLLMWVALVLLHFFLPELRLLQHSVNGSAVWVNTANNYLALLGVSAIQFWLGLRFKNFLVPVAVGFVLWLLGTVLVFEYHSPMATYFPHSFHALGMSPAHRANFQAVIWTSVGYAAFFLAVAFWGFQRGRRTS